MATPVSYQKHIDQQVRSNLKYWKAKDRHNLFEGRSPIILRGRREKGMYFFVQVFFKVFYYYLTGVISL
jgi:hypothetical protein